jgi:hypothetical protein
MPSSSVHHFQGSSPHSSAGSATGTPETQLTAFSPFSPENQLNKSISERIGVAFSASPVVPSGLRANIMDSLDKDPFVTQGKGEQKLSPTASAFQPFALRTGEGTSYSPMVVQSPGSTATIRSAKMPREKLTNTDPASPTSSQASGITQQGTFSTDTGATRALKVSGISAAVQVDLLNNLVLAYRQVGYLLLAVFEHFHLLSRIICSVSCTLTSYFLSIHSTLAAFPSDAGTSGSLMPYTS